MIKKKDSIHLIVCIWVLSLFVDQVKTSYYISAVKDLRDAINLIGLENVYMAKFIGVAFNNAYNPIKLFTGLIMSIPISSILMLVLAIIYYRTYRRGSFRLLLTFPILIFILNLSIVAISLWSNNPNSAFSFAQLFGKFTLFLSICGSLGTLIYWVYFEGANVDS